MIAQNIAQRQREAGTSTPPRSQVVLGKPLNPKFNFGHFPGVRSRYRVHEALAAHFITSTIVNWLPVFTTTARCDILVRALEFCRAEKGLQIYGWVILDNHFHAIVAASDLPRVVADLKQHTAKRLMELLESEGQEWLLHQFSFSKAVHKTKSSHQIWQEGVHPQALLSDEMMLQKLEYIHNNPVKRGLVVSPEHWRYSSAHEWLTGAIPVLRCDDWR